MENHTIILQFKLSNNGFGHLSELDFRHEFEANLKKILEPTGVGNCTGGQIGSGSMEIFIENVEDIDFALQIIFEHLNQLDLDREYKVVWRKNSNTPQPYLVAYATNKNYLFSFDIFNFEG